MILILFFILAYILWIFKMGWKKALFKIIKTVQENCMVQLNDEEARCCPTDHNTLRIDSYSPLSLPPQTT